MFSVRFSVRPPLLALSLLLCSLPAWAVYKCDSDGKVTYSDAACANGTTVAIDAASRAPRKLPPPKTKPSGSASTKAVQRKKSA